MGRCQRSGILAILISLVVTMAHLTTKSGSKKSKSHPKKVTGAMHPIWSGVMGFGLVNIPVHLYSPAIEEVLDLDYLHKKDKAGIRYAKICKAEEKEVPYEDIVRGYQYKRGGYVVLDDEDFAHANSKKTSMIDIQLFTDELEVDLMYVEKPYYLEPDKKAMKSYALFRAVLQQSGKVGIASFVPRNREHLVMIRPHGDVLMLVQLRFPTEVRSYSALDLPKDQKFSAKELLIATQLVKKMEGTFKPEKYRDTYTDDLLKTIQKKVKGLPMQKAERVQPTKASDMMALLKASLEQPKSRVRV